MMKHPIDIDKVIEDKSDAPTVHYTYQYRLYPTDAQRLLLSKHCGAVRFVYNHFLAEKMEAYKNCRQSSNYYEDQAKLGKLKNSKDYEWMYDVNSQSLQVALRNLSTSYLNFFRKKSAFPRFHSKKSGRDSFHIPQNIKIADGKLYIPKFKEGIEVEIDRPHIGNICFANIRKTKTCKYFVSITCEIGRADLQEMKRMDNDIDGKAIGIDLGIKDLVIASDGRKFKNLKLKKRFNKHISYLHRQLSKKAKGSSRRERARLRLARQYEKISNKRNNHIHQLTTRLVRENQTIAVESLEVQNMMKNHKLAGAIGDCSWGELLRQLKYKCDWYGRNFVQIDRFFPSSKMCHECGYVFQSMTLNDRKWTCPRCGHTHDRDVNAARNILSQGLNILKSGSGTESDCKQKPEEAFSVRSVKNGASHRYLSVTSAKGSRRTRKPTHL